MKPFSCRLLGPTAIALGALFLTYAPIDSYKGGRGDFDGGGGRAESGAYQAFFAVGARTAGPAASGAFETREGLLAFYGQPLLGADPGALVFGAVSLGGSRSLSAEVRNHGGVTLLLSGFRLASAVKSGLFAIEGPEADASILPGLAATVTVRFTPAEGPLVTDTLLANTNDPRVPVWRLPLSGSGLGEAGPAVALAADTLDFGSVPLDSVVSRTVTIENVGNLVLVVDSIAASDPSFGLSVTSFELAPGSNRDLVVWLNPAVAKLFQDTLRITSNDPSSPHAVLLLGSVPAILAVSEPEDKRVDFEAALDGPAPDPEDVRIRNDGAETLHWETVVTGASWLTLNPDSGSVPPGNTTMIDLTADHHGLGEGEYKALVRLDNRSRPLADAETLDVRLVVQPFIVQAYASPALVEEGGSVQIDASSTVTPDSGRAFYRLAGQSAFLGLAMAPVSGGGLRATLPGSAIGMRGVEWYVRIDAGGRSVFEPDPAAETPRRIAVDCADAPMPATPAGRYRMFGVPLSTEGAGAAALIEDDLGGPDPKVWRLGRWSETTGSVLEHPGDLGAPIDAGAGFWLITKESKTIRFGGRSIFPPAGEDAFAITLSGSEGSAGWNQIGHPFAFPVAWADCRIRVAGGVEYSTLDAADAALIENVAYAYVYDEGIGGYAAAGLLEPWNGYFVNNLSGEALELLVPLKEVPPAKNAAEPPLRMRDGEWEIRLRAVSDERRAEIVAGARSGAGDAWDAFDRFQPPPPDGEASILSIANGGGMPAPDDLGADVRAASPGGGTWEIHLRPSGGEVRLVVSGVETLPEGFLAHLFDAASGAEIPLDEPAGYQLASRPGEEVRRLQLTVGPGAVSSARSEGATARFELGRPIPNPAANGTTVRYTIPEAGEVRVRIFNIEGRLVRDFSEARADAGEHLVEWDTRDGRGREVGPGIYLIRVSYGPEARTARVVVFR
jgi:hypothetical protein